MSSLKYGKLHPHSLTNPHLFSLTQPLTHTTPHIVISLYRTCSDSCPSLCPYTSIYRDTAGQERYHSLAPMYYRGAAAAVVVYDVTHPSSFERAKKWVLELRQNVQNSNLIIALVGNKIDLVESRQVPEADARGYAAESTLLYFESSAKENICVADIFDTIADR